MRSLLCVAVLVWSVNARADSIEPRYEAAFQLRQAGRDAQALAILQEIAKEQPSARCTAQIAFAEQALGRWVDAEQHVLTALQSNDAWVLERKSTIEQALATIRAQLGSLEVIVQFTEASTHADPTLYVDGSPVGIVQHTKLQRLTVGRHRVAVRLSGYVSEERILEMPSDGHLREMFQMNLEPLSGAKGSTEHHQAPQVPHESTSPLRILAVGALSLAALGGVGAAASGIVSNGHAKDYNGDARCNDAVKPQACLDARDAMSTWRTVAWAAGISSAALLGTGVVLWIASPSAVRVSWLGSSVALTGRF